jgi:hypothetical protein
MTKTVTQRKPAAAIATSPGSGVRARTTTAAEIRKRRNGSRLLSDRRAPTTDGRNPSPIIASTSRIVLDRVQ